ncbi:hypothetical protein JHK84_032997 [Glycine max]|nr:hypothetical protein JHK85_033374 [Glycine max]KAG5139229.1 hypothetical protein JHK84_032997 [Glycine max]
MASLYDVLGISVGASCIEIKAAYRKLARTHHPDVVAMDQKESSANQFMMIHSAYSTLSDPEKRAQYDREIYRYRRSANIAGRNQTFSYAGSGRKWETDQLINFVSFDLSRRDASSEDSPSSSSVVVVLLLR